MKIFKREKYLKNQLAAAIRQREYLAVKIEEFKARNRGLGELIKIYEGICLVMGEDFIENLPYDAEEKNKRLSEILKLLVSGKEDLAGGEPGGTV